jgi:hypothetical protein
MIVVKVIGGLGNQLFQYAFGRNLSIKNKTALKIDLNDFKKYLPPNVDPKKAKPAILKFKIKASQVAYSDLENFDFNFFFFNVLKKISNRIFYFFSSILKNNYFYEFNYFKFYKINLTNKISYYFNGYWQNEKYFLDSRKEILQDIDLRKYSSKHQILLKKISLCNSVSIHIRRGERVKKIYHKNFPMPKIDYYIKAINLIKKKINNPIFFIFSDDILWAKKNIKLTNKYFVEGYSDCEDLISMKTCKNNIISNSTFSWWAAWLNINYSKIIICPKKWTIVSGKNFNPCPISWIKI